MDANRELHEQSLKRSRRTRLRSGTCARTAAYLGEYNGFARLRRGRRGARARAGVIEDITERKRAEEALRQREGELETVLANVPDVIARYGRDRRYRLVSGLSSGTPG